MSDRNKFQPHDPADWDAHNPAGPSSQALLKGLVPVPKPPPDPLNALIQGANRALSGLGEQQVRQAQAQQAGNAALAGAAADWAVRNAAIPAAKWLEENQDTVNSWLDPLNSVSRVIGSTISGENPFRWGEGGIHGPLVSEALRDKGVNPWVAAGAEFLVPDGMGAGKLTDLIPLLAMGLPAFRGIRDIVPDLARTLDGPDLVKAIDRALAAHPNPAVTMPEWGSAELRAAAQEILNQPARTLRNGATTHDMARIMERQATGMEYADVMGVVPAEMVQHKTMPDGTPLVGLRPYQERLDRMVEVGAMEDKTIDIGDLRDRIGALDTVEKALGEGVTALDHMYESDGVYIVNPALMRGLEAASALPDERGYVARQLAMDLHSDFRPARTLTPDQYDEITDLWRTVAYSNRGARLRFSAENTQEAITAFLGGDMTDPTHALAIKGMAPQQLEEGLDRVARMLEQTDTLAKDALYRFTSRDMMGPAAEDIMEAQRLHQANVERFRQLLESTDMADQAAREVPVVTPDMLAEIELNIAKVLNVTPEDLRALAETSPEGTANFVRERFPGLATEDVNNIVAYLRNTDMLGGATP